MMQQALSYLSRQYRPRQASCIIGSNVQQLVKPARFLTTSTTTATTSQSSDDTATTKNNNNSESPTKSLAKSQLYMWGTNTGPSTIPTTSIPLIWEPMEIDTSSFLPEPIDKVICGATDTAFLLTDGSLYVCGQNKNGQLGVGHTNAVSEPTLLASDVQSISIGPTASAFITKEGDLYTFGSGGSFRHGVGILGHGSADSYLEPKLVESIVEDGCYAKQVVMGESHMTVLTTEGEVLTTGSSSYGRLGNGESSLDRLYLEPVEILTQNTTAQIVGGKSFTLALQNDGTIYGWGRNHKGQLGTGFGMAVDMYSMEDVPYQIESDELSYQQVVQLAAGPNHAAAVTSTGEIYVWGMSEHLEPIRIDALLHEKIQSVACGNDCTMVLSESGHVYVWGRGKTGVLGLGPSTTHSHQPMALKTMADQVVQQIYVGWAHAAATVVQE